MAKNKLEVINNKEFLEAILDRYNNLKHVSITFNEETNYYDISAIVNIKIDEKDKQEMIDQYKLKHGKV